MENKKTAGLYQKIKDLAQEALKNNNCLTRADLAYDLRNWGIENDSFRINELVWNAYQYFGQNEMIRTAFLDNESKRYLVDQFLVYGLIENKKSQELASYLYQNLSDGLRALTTLGESIGSCLKLEMERQPENIMSTIVGTRGVQQVQKEASTLFDRYSSMVNSYHRAKTETKAIVGDFVGVRGYIHEIYNRYTLALTDIFGDSIKAVAPDLFDYDRLEWLDIDEMIQYMQLEYNRMMDRCGELMGEISDSFQNGLKMAVSNYKMSGNKTVGLMMASLNMVSHYMYGSQQTTELKTQLLTLKNSVKRDTTQIKADLGRMMVIYKTMNELYIPRANAFYRFSQQVLDKELEQLLNTLYSNPEVARLKQERDQILERYKHLERQITDSQANISYYTAHLAECRSLTTSMKAQYQAAQSKKPKKPFLCFGTIKSRYNREIAEWYELCEPVIRRYEDFQVDLRLDSEELEKHQKILQESTADYDVQARLLKESGKKIRSAIRVDQHTQTTMLKHLEALIKLLHVGREIMEARLDERLIQSVKIEDNQHVTLPAEIKQKVQNFITATKQDLSVDTTQARESLNCLNDMAMENPKDMENYSEEDLLRVAEAQSQAIQHALSLFEAFGKLKIKEQESRIKHEAYDKELKELQQKFRLYFKDIDDKSAVLRETLRKLNTSQSLDHLKEALMELSESDTTDFTEKDWNDFLNGNKTIVI